jgi:hypothetical protein
MTGTHDRRIINNAMVEQKPAEHKSEEPRDAEDGGSRRGALIGLVLVAALIIGGVMLVHVLRNASRLQDCVLSGRTNCAPIDSQTGR